MDMQMLIWIVATAAGILIFKFVSLFSWDMLKYVPMPWGPFCDDEPSKQRGKWHFKFWLFIAGGALATIAINNTFDDHPNWTTWILLGSFSAPTVAVFAGRLILAVGYGIFTLYERTEVIYESCKTNIVKFCAGCNKAFNKHLRKKGYIE